MTAEAPVLYAVTDGIAHIRLNRPAALNALAPESIRALAEVWDRFALDRAARVGVVSGEGAGFCAGMDLKRTDPGFGERGADPAAGDRFAAARGEPRRIAYVPPPTLQKPLVAAMHGVALGGGLEIALGCDVRVAARGARFGLPEATRGLVPGSGGMFWLPRIVGWGPAMELMLTGRIIDDAEALALRLVNRLVDPGALLPEAMRVAALIAANAPLAVQAVRETAWRTAGAGVAEALAVAEHQIRVLRLTQDYEEGAKAFAERRRPDYRGT